MCTYVHVNLLSYTKKSPLNIIDVLLCCGKVDKSI